MAANRSNKGFSLIELMVALTILTVGMAAIGTMLISAFWHDRKNSEDRTAESILRRVAEGFAAGNPEALPLSSPPTGTGSAVVRGRTEKVVNSQKTYDIAFITNVADVAPGNYYCSWTASVFKTTAAGTVNRIDIVVGWGKPQTGVPCDRSSPGTCPHRIRLTNYY